MQLSLPMNSPLLACKCSNVYGKRLKHQEHAQLYERAFRTVSTAPTMNCRAFDIDHTQSESWMTLETFESHQQPEEFTLQRFQYF